MIELDLSLNNEEIYRGVKIESFGGRKSFTVNQGNLDIIGKNITEYIKRRKEDYKNKNGDKNLENELKNQTADFNDVVILTGATAIPVYLVAFHIVVHSFHEVRYKNEMYEVVAAKH
jgi:hypothetical protein